MSIEYGGTTVKLKKDNKTNILKPLLHYIVKVLPRRKFRYNPQKGKAKI